MSSQEDEHARRSPQMDDPAAEFAQRLRELRSRAGSPSFRQLAKVTNYSSSALAEATSGKRLPSQAIVRAFAAGCGADPDEWLSQLQRAAQTRATQPAAPAEPAVLHGDASAQPVWQRRALLAVVGVVLLAAGALLGASIHPGTALPASLGNSVAERATASRAADGADPIAAGCTGDAHLVRSVQVQAAGRQIGTLELRYSMQCAAGWARIYLKSGEPRMLAEVTVQAADGRLAAFAYPLSGQMPAYTDVISPGRKGCLTASATFRPAGHSPVTTTIPCQNLAP